jgi:hypothetical protein
VGQLQALLSQPGNAGLPFFFGASVENNAGLIFSPDATSTTAGGLFAPSSHDFTGNGTLLTRQTGTNSNWQFSDSATFQFNTVPEPSSMVSLAIGGALLGLGTVLSRRKLLSFMKI